MTAPAIFGTAERIIRMAYQDSGIVQRGDNPSGEQLADGMMRLNDMANIWQINGLKLWLQSDLSVPLVAGQRVYSLSPTGDVAMDKPMRVLDSCYYLDSNDIQRPLTLLNQDDYNRLGTVLQEGSVNSLFPKRLARSIDVYLWLVPDTQAATGTVHLLIQGQVPNVVSLTDEMVFPSEWFMALRWGLADDVCTGQPQAIMDRCQSRASMYRAALEDWDVEDTTVRFQPSPQAAMPSRFR